MLALAVYVRLEASVKWAALCGLASWFIAGCAGQPIAHNVIGPNGLPAVHVACGSDQGACFELAGRSCPGGYDLAPVFDPHDNNFLVSCRMGPAPALASASPVTQSPSVSTWPGPSPWPSTNATVAVGNPPPWPTAETRSASGSGNEVDLGY